MMTVDDCLRAAFQALLKGNTAERDRLCRMAESMLTGKMENPMQPIKPILIERKDQ